MASKSLVMLDEDAGRALGSLAEIEFFGKA